MNRSRIIFRQTEGNRYTLPVLLNLLESCPMGEELQLDIAQSHEELARKIEEGIPTIVAYSFMTPHLKEVRSEVISVRSMLGPEDLLVAGGAHPTADPAGTLELGFDIVVVGEGERILPMVAEKWARGDLRGLPRVMRDEDPCPLELSIPASRRLRFMAPLEITRGCSHNCAYCLTPRIHRKPVRHRPLHSVRRYLEASHHMGKKVARFIAPDAFSYRDPSKGEELASIAELLRLCRDMGMERVHLGDFPSEVRPDRVRPEFLQLIATHCVNRKIVIGAQSGSDSLLERIHRGHTVKDVVKAVREVINWGFLAHVDMLFGLPGETPGDRMASLRLLDQLAAMGRVKIRAHVYLPLPGTPVFRMDPPKLEDSFVANLEELERRGVLDGDWKSQMEVQREILQWREKGLIKA